MYVLQQLTGKAEPSKTNVCKVNVPLEPKSIIRKNETRLSGEASSKISYSSELSESTGAFDVDTWFQSSDEETGSAPGVNPLLPARSVLAIRLICAYFTCTSKAGEDNGPRSSDISGPSSEPEGSSQSSERLGKRRRTESCSSGSNHGPKPSRRRRMNSSASEEKLLACPFCKHEPRKYRDCYRYVMRNISRLK